LVVVLVLVFMLFEATAKPILQKGNTTNKKKVINGFVPDIRCSGRQRGEMPFGNGSKLYIFLQKQTY